MIQEEFMQSLLIPKKASREGFRLGTDGEAQLACTGNRTEI
jgi:hypothetical protein